MEGNPPIPNNDALPMLAADYNYQDPLAKLGPNVLEEGDQPFIDEILRLRRGVELPDVSPFSLDWWRYGPILQEVVARGRQGKYGVPTAQTYFEANRFRPMGIGSGQARMWA